MAEITRDEYEGILEELDERLKKINIFDNDSTAAICEELEQIAERKRRIESCYMHNGETVYCPALDFNCPYYNCGRCGIEDPIEDCDAFCYEEEEEEEGREEC